MPIPAERTSEYTRYEYGMLKAHNSNAPRANSQLEEAAVKYPFAHRITTQDSAAYYYGQGYRYVLFYNAFNSVVNQKFQGTHMHTSFSGGSANTTMTTTSTDLYVLDMATGDRYGVDSFSETFIYYYKGIVGMLVKRANKQFEKK